MARPAREPLRTCVGCRRVRPKSQLVRVVAGRDGWVVADRSGREPGRGAYVCPDEACVTRAKRRLASALRVSVVDVAPIMREVLK